MNKNIQYCALCGKRLDTYAGVAPSNALVSFRVLYQHASPGEDASAPGEASSSHPLEAYLPYIEMICAAAYQLTRDKEAAERLVCETFTTVLRHTACDSAHASPKRRLLSTLRNTFLEHGFPKA